MSPAIPNSHPQTPSSALNPNAPPFNNSPAPRRSMPLALLPPPPTKTQTHTDAKISPLPLKPTAAGDHSQAFFYHPAVIPNPNRLFFYYYCYPLPHTQPYVLPPSPVYMNNNHYYHPGGFRPIAICPQPSPPPLLLNHSTETVPVPVTEPNPLPATVVPNGGDRARIIGSQSGDDGGFKEGWRRQMKRRKRKTARVVHCTAHRRQRSFRSLPLAQYRKTNNTSATAAGRATNEFSPALTSEGGGRTTLMIKNIPNRFMRGDLLRYLDNHCALHNNVGAAAARQLTSASDAVSDFVPSEYDFFYLPMDFSTGANLGYAFVNFTTAIGASRFEASFQNYKWEELVRPPNWRKVCKIVAAKFQGKERLIEHFRGSRFHCRYNSYLPACFSPPRDGSNASIPILVGQRLPCKRE